MCVHAYLCTQAQSSGGRGKGGKESARGGKAVGGSGGRKEWCECGPSSVVPFALQYNTFIPRVSHQFSRCWRESGDTVSQGSFVFSHTCLPSPGKWTRRPPGTWLSPWAPQPGHREGAIRPSPAPRRATLVQHLNSQGPSEAPEARAPLPSIPG